MPSIDLGSVVGPQGAQGATGPQGPQGPQGEAGPSQVTGTTSTTLTGLLYGNGSVVGTKQIGEDVAPQAQISDVFPATAVYAVGAYVVYNGLLYRCTTAHSGAWNAAHFEQVTIGGELNTRTPVYGGGVNLLDNWYFVGGGSQQGGGQFPINQKGQTNYIGSSAGSVSVDRWSSYLNVAISESYITLSHGVASSFVQYLNTREVKGKQCTLSFLTGDNALYSGAFSFPDNFPVIGSLVTYFDLRISTGTFLRASYDPVKGFPDCRIVVLDGGTPITVKAIKLELGDTQTLAHQDAGGNWILNDPPPNFQQELAKCQRYFQVFRDQNLRPAYGMDYRPPMAKEQPTQSSFVLDGVTYYTASAEL